MKKATVPPVAAGTHALNSTIANRPAVESGATPAESVAKVPVATNATTDDQARPVTITGCLELADETFRLKDTDGADVPKARSWRSGFLKKHSASVELVDTARTLRLPNYVGQRVAATGMLMNRELQVRSLQRMAVSCS